MVEKVSASAARISFDAGRSIDAYAQERVSARAGFGTIAADDRLRIVSDHCPFGGAPIEHPVICAVDRGLVPLETGGKEIGGV